MPTSAPRRLPPTLALLSGILLSGPVVAQGPQSIVVFEKVPHFDGISPDKFTFDLKVLAPTGYQWVSATMSAVADRAVFVQDSGGAANHGPPNPGQQSSSARYDSFWTLPGSFPNSTSNAAPSFPVPPTVLSQTLAATWAEPGALPPNSGQLRTIARVSIQPDSNLPVWCLTVNGQVAAIGPTGVELTPFSFSECVRRPGVPTKPLLTEATSSADPRGFEIVNFHSSPVNMAGWKLRYRDGNGTFVSAPLGMTLAPGGRVVVQEPGVIPGLAPNTPTLVAFGPIASTTSAFTVALLDEQDLEVDEVRVSNLTGFHPGWSFGGTFRGVVTRTNLSAGPSASVERIWSLDSDSGGDWTEQPQHSLGLENQSSGSRGSDPVAVPRILVSEVDDNPDYIELYNADTVPVDLKDFCLLCSADQGQPITTLRPFPNSLVLPPNSYVVIGESGTLPPEMPPNNLFVNAGVNIPFDFRCFELALYDTLGRVLDVMRTTGHDDVQVHNHPRVPSPWSDFTGAAGRTDGAAPVQTSIARVAAGLDTDRGVDWRGSYVRTMGLPNTGFSATPGFGDVYDVRLNEGAGDGLEVILNAGPASAGWTYSFAYGVGHANGAGPFLGLGIDALANFLGIYGVSPWTGTLDALGGARFGFPGGSLPPGIALDCVFLLQDGTGLLAARTYVLAFDS